MKFMFYEQKFLFSLLLTVLIEIPVVVIFLKKVYKHAELKNSQIIFVGAIASALTLPYLWFVLPLWLVNRNAYIFGGEFLVIFVEAVIYYKLLNLKLSEAIIVSLVANLMSVLLGFAIAFS